MQLRVNCLLYNRVLVLNILKQTLSSFTVSRHKQVESAVFAALQIVILLTQILINVSLPYPPLDNVRVMVIVWRLRRNIIRTAACWVV